MSFLSDIFNPVGHAFQTVGNGIYSGLKTAGQGIYDAGKWGAHQLAPIVSGLAPVAGTIAGGYLGGPMGAQLGGMAGGALGNALGGTENASPIHQAIINGGTQFANNRYNAKNNYGRAPARPQLPTTPRMPVARQRATTTPRGSREAPFAYGGHAFAKGGHSMGMGFGNMFSHLIPASLRQTELGGVGPEMGAIGGRRVGHEMLNRMPTQSLYNMAGGLENKLAGLLQRQLPAKYQGRGQQFAHGLGSFSKRVLDRTGIGAQNLPELLSNLPEYTSALGRQGGGFLSSLMRPFMDREMRKKTVGDIPGMVGGYLGNRIEDRLFGEPHHAEHPASHAGHAGHPAAHHDEPHHSSGEYEGISNLFPEEHAAHGGHMDFSSIHSPGIHMEMPEHFAHGGYMEPHYASGGLNPLNSDQQHSMANGIHSAGNWLSSHFHSPFAHGGSVDLMRLAHMLQQAESMGHGGH